MQVSLLGIMGLVFMFVMRGLDPRIKVLKNLQSFWITNVRSPVLCSSVFAGERSETRDPEK